MTHRDIDQLKERLKGYITTCDNRLNQLHNNIDTHDEIHHFTRGMWSGNRDTAAWILKELGGDPNEHPTLHAA